MLARKNRGSGRPLQRRAALAEIRHAYEEKMLKCPPLGPIMRGSTSIRYRPAATGVGTLTAACLLASVVVSTTTTNVVTIFEAVKLRKMHVWIPGAVTTSSTAVAPPSCLISIRDFAVPGIGVEKETVLVSTGADGAYFCHKFRGVMSEWFNLVGISSAFAGEVIASVIPNTSCIPVVQLDFSYQIIQTNSDTSAANLAFDITVDATSAGAVLYLPMNSLTTFSTEGLGTYTPVGVASATVNLPLPAPVSSGTFGPVVSSSSSGRRLPH